MNLYLIKHIGSSEYDVNAGLVIRAANEADARATAIGDSSDEGPLVWLDPNQSTCEVLATDVVGGAGIVLRDFRAW